MGAETQVIVDQQKATEATTIASHIRDVLSGSIGSKSPVNLNFSRGIVNPLLYKFTRRNDYQWGRVGQMGVDSELKIITPRYSNVLYSINSHRSFAENGDIKAEWVEVTYNDVETLEVQKVHVDLGTGQTGSFTPEQLDLLRKAQKYANRAKRAIKKN